VADVEQEKKRRVKMSEDVSPIQMIVIGTLLGSALGFEIGFIPFVKIITNDWILVSIMGIVVIWYIVVAGLTSKIKEEK
jgi:hypothetical protein